MPTAFPAIIIIQKNLEVSAHKYTGLQKNFSQIKLISENIQKITNQKVNQNNAFTASFR